jgi:AcrR family transcriptional regulator
LLTVASRKRSGFFCLARLAAFGVVFYAVAVMKNSERRVIKVDLLLKASLAQLQDVGYARFRTADVSNRSGLTEGALFRYFPTKLNLVTASLERTLQDHLQRLVDQFVVLDGDLHRRSLMTLLWEVLSHPELVWTYGLYAAAATEPALANAIRPVLEKHSEHIDCAVHAVVAESAVVPVDDVANIVNMVTWVMQGLALSEMGRGASNRQVELIDFLEKLGDAAYPTTPKKGRVKPVQKATVATRKPAKPTKPAKPAAKAPPKPSVKKRTAAK